MERRLTCEKGDLLTLFAPSYRSSSSSSSSSYYYYYYYYYYYSYYYYYYYYYYCQGAGMYKSVVEAQRALQRKERERALAGSR